MNCKTNASAPSGGCDLVSKTFTANGTYDATDEGYDGYNPVTVNVSVTPPEPTGYVRPTGVPNGEVIIANAPDIEKDGVTYKPIYYLCAMDTFNNITFSKTATGSATGADAYVFSDEPSTLYVGTSVAHTFDATADYTTSEEWNCRYIIMYATAANKASASGITVNLYNYRATFEMIGASGTIFSNTTALFGYSSDTTCQSIKYVDISNCSFYNNNIGASYFMAYIRALTEIKLPESITTVGGRYFCSYCYSLTSLSLPNLTTVSSYFCYQCYSLTSLSLPNLTTVGEYFCTYCYSLTSLSLPNLTTVSSYFCGSCSSLTSLSLPNLTTVSSYFCGSCSSLTSLSLPNLTTVSGYFCVGCYSLTTMSLPNLTTVNGISFCSSCASLTSLSLPNLTTVGDGFCNYCSSLTSLSLPNLTTVSEYFCGSCRSLTALSLPNLTKVTGSYFCGSCYSLSYVDLSAVNSLTNTSSATLDYCRYITLPIDFDISDVSFTGATGYTKSLDWLNNELPTKLKDNSGGTAKTMTLGAANIALIGATAAATIAAKNWTIS